ncbi:MAG TPA: protein translocase subunit SecD [Candidatus Fusicatenibacter merdavium]|uniref:Multifunctional fusion protein n=1 Tax=Candidatus Fusicatenibacter merdavium TaxID=2838600 RepID=A0A9D1XD82_9FIRM|nr:protein translocase subunit SecD [Candidatus Fusicatenibacter merdavium]
MKKKQSIAVLIVAVVLTVLLGWTAIVGWGPTGTGAMRNINLGLDLSGGVSITYQAVEENPSAEDMSDTRYKLEQRAYQYSTEAQVYQQGDNRITIDIPGATDANEILTELGKPGSLYFIAEKDADGNQNYVYDSTVGNYVLNNKTLEDLQNDGSIVLTGQDLENAEAVHQQDSTTQATTAAVELRLTDEGAEKFATATEKAAEAGETIGIYYDEEFVSVPVVNDAITDGVASISGSMDWEEASNLAATLRIGGLSLELTELDSSVVGAQLGSEAVSSSVFAGALGLIVIVIFLICVYRVPGAAAGWALVLYVELILIALNAFDITLTLPGIAGIILSIGMAVDANVIIYARMKEELAAGKSVSTSIREGFQKAFSAIFDGNITTLIAAAILYILGSGSVRGFAITLALGIILSMFTAMVISRLLVSSLYSVGVRSTKWYGVQKERKVIHFVEHRKIYFAISAILLLAVPVGMIYFHVTQGSMLNYSMEFMGGTSVTVPFNEEYTIEELDSEVFPVVQEVTGDSDIQMTTVVDSTNVVIRTRSLSLEEREKLYNSLEENFGVDSSKITFQNISATISSEMSENAIKAVIISIICMLIYIWFRFKDLRFASSAILALVHDIIIVFGVYVFTRISVGNTFIACMLTILGYSINATIVIFDRIRENMTIMKKEPLEVLVNQSVTQTLTRSIYSNLTTFVTIFILFLVGVSSIRDFAAPLMVGIGIGTYTSVCLTGSMWYLFKHFGKNKYVPVKPVSVAEVQAAGVSAAGGKASGTQKKKKKKKRKQ